MHFIPAMRSCLVLSISLFTAACAKETQSTSAPVTTDKTETASAAHDKAIPTSSPSDPSDDRCQKLCKNASALNCRAQDDCSKGCAEMRSGLGECSGAMTAFIDCALAQPVSNFECNEDGLPSAKEGVCNAEQSVMVKCATSAQPPP